MIIVDFVVVCSRSHSENLKIPMQNPFSRPLIDSKGKELQKLEIGLQIERSDTSADRVCHACARKIRVHNFISSSLPKRSQRSTFLMIQADANVYCQPPFRRLIGVLFCLHAEDLHFNTEVERDLTEVEVRLRFHLCHPFSSPEAALLLVSTKNRDLWPRPLAKSNTGSPRFTDFPSLCACSESNLTNLIGSDLNLLCLQSHSKTEYRWTRPEVAILGADQK